MVSSQGSGTSHDHHYRRRKLKQFVTLQRRPKATCLRMRSSTSPPTSSSIANLKEQLHQLVQHVHKISADHNITNDSGVSFFGEASSSKQTSREASGSSKASTITPETAAYRASTLTADKVARRPPSISASKADSLEVPSILTQLGPEVSDENNVVASPSSLRTNDTFFSRTSPVSISPLSAQDIVLDDTWTRLAKELRPIANIMRTGQLRTPLGQSELPSHCVVALELWLDLQASSSDDQMTNAVMDAHIEIFRVLANLCIDHEQIRTVLGQFSAAPVVLNVVSALLKMQSQSRSTALFSIKFLSLLRAAMGAVLNMQLEHIPTRRSLVNANCLSTLTQVATHTRVYVPNIWKFPQSVELENDSEVLEKLKMGAMVCSWAWRIVQEVYDDAKEESDQSKQNMSDDDMHDDDLRDNDNADIKSLLSTHCFFQLLQPLLLYTPSSRLDEMSSASQPLLALDVEDVEDLVAADIEILQSACELVEGCGVDTHIFRTNAITPLSNQESKTHVNSILDLGSTSALDLLMTFVQDAQAPSAWLKVDDIALEDDVLPSVNDASTSAEAIKIFAKIKADVARTVVAISGDDANMVKLFDPSSGFIDRLKSWMRYDAKDRDDLVSCGMLALGNLARSDSHCLSLVQEHELAPFLASLLSKAQDIKVAHGLVSLLKNLSIPVANKVLIGDLGFIDSVIPFLGKEKDMVQPLQFATVGLLKHLCANVQGNAIRLVGGDSGNDASALNALVDMIRRIDDVPTKLESTRVLVNVVKSLWSSPKSGARDGLNEVVMAARTKLVRRDVIQSLAEMVRTSPKYPVLVNEGILALTLIGSDRSGAELVSLSLLAEPAKADAEADEDQSDLDEAEDDLMRGVTAARKRRSTAESVGSTSSHPLPPPLSALDMVNSVLARRDARMPPQFACNACMLVLTLCQSVSSPGFSASADDTSDMAVDKASTGAVGQEAVVRMASKTRAALELLSTQGPVEALEPADRALQAVSKLN